jgi:hypothetical protein
MNEFGEPNMGNPSVRFDEGRERVGHWPLAFQSNRSCLLYETENYFRRAVRTSCNSSLLSLLSPVGHPSLKGEIASLSGAGMTRGISRSACRCG